MEWKDSTYFMEAARKWLEAYQREEVDATADSGRTGGVRARGAAQAAAIAQGIAQNVHYLAYVLGIAYYSLGLWRWIREGKQLNAAANALSSLVPGRTPAECRHDLETAHDKLRDSKPSLDATVDVMYGILTQLFPCAAKREKALLRFILKRELFRNEH